MARTLASVLSASKGPKAASARLALWPCGRREGGLVAGGMFGGVKRVGEAPRRTPRRERLLLALVRVTAHQIDDLEARSDSAVGRAVTGDVNFLRALERAARQWRLPPRRHDVAAAERSDLAHQRAWAWIGHGEKLGVGHRQREARALEKRAVLAHIGEGRDTGACPAMQLGFGLDQHLSKLLQRPAAKGRAHEQPVGAKAPANLDERPGEIVDAVERKARDHEAEAHFLERQHLLIADHGRTRAAGRE